MPDRLRDTATIFFREITPELRSPVSMFFTMGQPLLFLVLFGSMLVGADANLGAGTGDVWQWFVPGILVMMCLMGPLSAGHSMLSELNGGQLERLLVTPISRTSIIFGRTGKDTVTLFVQAILITAVAVPLGMELHLPGALATMGLLIVMAVGLSALSYVLAIASRPSGNLFWIVTQMLIFPIMLLSGILLPIDAGPGWLGTIAAINPITYVVDAARALFTGNLLEATVLHGLLAATAIAVIGLTLSTRAMKRGI
ncbi:ABC transporter permease [Frankia sp. CNm7]|uniref:Transport permease protein n=1 Tax=Frankia nepalensis TaxID=1836974 RepID=A0A937UV94_9ACTN|nr:ABC transporter permease [Frankia nepalensis]MBL7502658.1 ABC transporter permease [Frankia nepalensis]MBL7514884.1 ABC transporter permease [Frankia nepalensis]MBL7524617.1 ABC transporter permease [Frankia nepalensis]MBL7633030.1 ABC transporter permease [Frankia nepalensis]